ncbi:cysteine desulfurase family protein [Oceanobacillus kimchii]|uniref:cysteine desulfurase family protein n=1 Tax=Oceanobacillus kimchii TaxID=746691 RepID=UPI000986E372|nr:cysteine desulfurase family protein [Oceanobacillus kimchii]
MIYLDNSATTQPKEEVIQSFQLASSQFFANPSSIHPLGGRVEKLLFTAKQQVAETLGVRREEIIFTSGGTEGNNTAIKGIALEHEQRGRHIITTEAEHPSIYDTCISLKKLGFRITFLPVDENGLVSVEQVENAIESDTILITMMYVNNEIGTIQPIEAIGNMLKQYPKVFFHVDAVQALGKVPLKLSDSGIDLCTFSGHKIHGLKGTGMLYVEKTTTLFPLMHGGNQEFGVRSGTENVAGAVSFVKALRLVMEQFKQEKEHLIHLNEVLREGLSKLEDIVIHSPSHGAPHIVNFSVLGVKPEVIIHTLSEKDIYISTKSACSSKELDESRILIACGKSHEEAISGLRVSFSYNNTVAEVEQFLKELHTAIEQYKEALG